MSNCLWKIINNVVPSKERPTLTYSKDHKLVADKFNQFFSSVGRKTADEASRLALENNIDTPTTILSSTPPVSSPGELFYFRPVTCTEVQNIIVSMPSNKSPGLDKINMRVIKDSLPVILGPLTDIINCSLNTSTYPTAWKKAEVIPLLKDGDHEQASNNRLLSLLPVASKVCEKVMLSQFNSYLTRNNHLSSHQSGNKKHFSTETLTIYLKSDG